MYSKEKRIIFLDPRNIHLNNSQNNELERYRLLLLSESIRENGLIIPVTVRKSGKDYFAVCGEKRIKAAILAGKKKIPCIFEHCTEPELYRAVENFGKHSDDIFERSDILFSLLKKYTSDNLACVLGVSTKELANILAVKQLSEQTKEKLKNCDIMDCIYERLYTMNTDEQLEFIENTVLQIKGKKEEKESEIPRKIHREPQINDKRFFINTIRKTADSMKQNGIETTLSQTENSKAIEIKIRIKKTEEDNIQLSLLPEESA